jgi:hypothetical protein
MIFIPLFISAYSFVAFYFAVNNILNIHHIDYTDYNYVANDTQYARSVEVAAMLKKNEIEILKTTCESVRYQLSQVIIPNITYIEEMKAQNKTCHEHLDNVNRTLQEARNGNGTTILLDVGTCLFLNTTIDYLYKRLTLTGYDFYYYQFPESNSIFTNSSVFYIESCVPNIFQGSVLINKTYTSGINSVGGVSYLEMGQGKLKIQMQTGMQTVQLEDLQIIN